MIRDPREGWDDQAIITGSQYYSIDEKGIKATESIKNWIETKEKKCLVVQGARQTGKTYTIERFAEEAYEELVEINFKEIELPDTLQDIGKCAFAWCKKLKHIEFPAGLKTIGYRAFVGCKSVTEIELFDAVETVESGIFAYCSGLQRAILPDSLSEFGDDLFWKCENLTYVRLPKNLKRISGYMFGYCRSLQSLEIPATVQSIDMDAFRNMYDCNLYFLGNMPVLSSMALDFCRLTIYYKASNRTWDESKWKGYKSSINFVDCTDLTEPLLVENISNKSNGVKIEWCTVLGASTYVVEREASDGDIELLAELPANQGTSYTDQTMNSGERYIYHVKALDGSGMEAMGVADQILYLAKPEHVLAVNNRSGIVVKWDSVSGAAGYQVYRATSASGKYTRIATLDSSTACKYVDKNVTDLKKYYYKVRAVSNDQTVTYSSFSTPDYVYYVASPSLKSVISKEAGTYIAKWTASAGAVRYEIQYSTSSSFASAKTAVSPATSTAKKISGLKKGKTYYVRIRVLKNVDNKDRASGWSAVKKVQV